MYITYMHILYHPQQWFTIVWKSDSTFPIFLMFFFLWGCYTDWWSVWIIRIVSLMTKQEPRAFATASPEFSGEMGSCVSANTKNLGTIDPESRDRQQEFMNTEKLNTMLYIHIYIYIYIYIYMMMIIIIYIYMWYIINYIYIYDIWYILFYNYSQNYNTLDIDT